jgi:hypothetical protein
MILQVTECLWSTSPIHYLGESDLSAFVQGQNRLRCQVMTELSKNIINTDVDASNDDIWEKLKHGIYEVMEKNIPSKLTSNRHNLPWINHKLKRGSSVFFWVKTDLNCLFKSSALVWLSEYNCPLSLVGATPMLSFFFALIYFQKGLRLPQ